jgi:hypothetical protein
MKNLRPDQIGGLICAGATVILALIALAIPQGGLTVAESIIFIGLVVFLAYLALENRRCIIAHNFREYCVKCRQMLGKSGKHGMVTTIQTPIRDIPADAKEAFECYMDKTFDMLISTECDYKRLVVLEADGNTPETRIKTFVDDLIMRAKEREHSHRDGSFDLHNVHIGFVTTESVQDAIYSNVDIHCTTDRDFSIAFMGKQAQQGIHFGSSLHLHDSKTSLSRLIQNDFQAVWDRAIANAAIITIGDYYSNYDGIDCGPKNDVAVEGIKSVIKSQIDAKVNGLKARQCPCHACVDPHIFLARINATNPTWLQALKQLLAQ